MEMRKLDRKSVVDGALATAKMSPLVAAVLAPVAALYSIPPATQPWYQLDGTALPDPTGCKALAFLSLGISIAATLVLALRFSKLQKRWRELTLVSTGAWTVTVILQIVNLAVFGSREQHGPEISKQEGFWCAIWSVILAGTCAVFLLFHFFVEYGRPPTDDLQVRLTGGHFIRVVLVLVGVVALEALIFSKVEGWEFFDAVYFAVVSMETIGFGDLYPTKAATKILLFPFGIVTVALLANLITMIVSFISSLVDVRRQQWRAEYAKRAERKIGDDGDRPVGLEDEVNYLSKIGQHEERMSQYFDLAGSLLPFMGFWFIGAVVYRAFEGWTYGNAVYFSYVMFFTFGYGDFSPKSAGGRSFFVLHSLIGVPILSFALGVVTNIVSSISDGGFNAESLEADHGEDVMETHADLVEEQHAEIDRELTRTDDSNKGTDLKKAVTDDDSAENKLLDDLISAGCSLEATARRIMMNQLPEGSAPQTLLRADRNQQLRDMRSLGVDEGEMNEIMSEEGDGNSDLMQQTTKYRKTFAAFLATASRLRDMHGRSQKAFERRRGQGDAKVGRGQGNADLSGFVDGQEKAKGTGGQSDNLQSGGEDQEARDQEDGGKSGPATGIEKAMNVSKA